MTLGLNVLVRIYWAKCCAKKFRLQDPYLREKSSCFPLTILRFGILDLGSVLEDDMLDTQFIVQSKYLILCSSYPSQCICITYRLLSTMWTIDEEDFTSSNQPTHPNDVISSFLGHLPPLWQERLDWWQACRDLHRSRQNFLSGRLKNRK